MRTLLLSSILIISVLFFFTACNPPAPAPSGDNQSSDTTQTADTSATDTPSDTDTPADAAETPAADETIETAATPGTVPFSDLPTGWREDIPLLEGFEVQTFTALPNNGMFALTKGNVNPDIAYNFYKALPGWETDPDAPVGTVEDDRTIGLKQGDMKLTIAVIMENGETLLNISANVH